VRRALPAAVAVELLHNFTLIHDDIEDQSDTRHGRPTLWRTVGVPQAINAGDGMFVLAQRALLDLAGAGVPDGRVLAASRMLNDACVELCEGQHHDRGFEQRAAVSLREYEAMIRGKSAVLLRAACGGGALVAGGDAGTVAAFEEFGLSLGLAFQVRDDVLGIWGESNQTGKSAGDDIRTRKKSFPVVYALEHLESERRDELRRIYAHPAQDVDDTATVRALLESADARTEATRTAQAHADAAISAIAEISVDAERGADLEALARFAVSRDA
jgi:geranylgeranyl diphosphate synthase type I